ncbi:MAG: class I SAM-dependent methyltransferase [Rhodospirillales bacterium]|nr:class I SAM-dependent methyltransferase [Rhodospirillales bacterium]
MLLARLLERGITNGRLTVIDARGRKHEFGQDASPAVAIRLHDRALHWRLLLNPALAAGEAYMDGTLTMERGSLYDFLDLVGRNSEGVRKGTLADRLSLLLRRLHQHNSARLSRRNVAHHYDISERLYDLFLDRDRQYSCAYFPDGDESLETAQLRKKQHIAAKLLLKPGQRVLDIGCGWGGLALYLAETWGVDVTGITLAENQVDHARQRLERASAGDRVRFALRDYRDQTGSFERIVSVGMFEHVGIVNYRSFFDKLAELLADDGVALLHTIGRCEPPGATNAWLRKYIFPGGYSPALSEVLPAIEQAGLWVTDIEVLRLHYAYTLRHWRRRLIANWGEVAALHGERFCRMWDFYLAGCEMAFRYDRLAVFQIQLSKSIEAVPLTRDYMFETERRVRRERHEAADQAA